MRIRILNHLNQIYGAAVLSLAVGLANVATAQHADVVFNPANPGEPADWNVDGNWDPSFRPEAQLNEVANIDENFSAFVADMPPDVGGIVIIAGGLEIREGGKLTAAPHTVVEGNLTVGQGSGTGNLTVRGGGILNVQHLSTGGSGASQITLGETGGTGTATFFISGGTLNRTTRIVGPDVDFSSSGELVFQGSSVLVPVITGAAHSAINVSGTAVLAGTVQPEFDGYTPALGDSWNLISAGDLEGAFSLDLAAVPAISRGTGFQLTQTATSTALQYTNKLVLTVDRATGQTRIANVVGDPISLEAYTISSPGGHLGGAWNSLEDQSLGEWDEADNANSSRLTEFSPTGDSVVGAGSMLSLGTPYAPPTPTEFGQAEDLDLSFQYATPGQGTVEGIVEFTGPHNNLVLTIDPSTGGAAIQNESPYFDVAIEAYTITSAAERLLTGDANWNSLADQSLSGWDEADNADGFRLTEFNPTGETPLAGGGTVLQLGAPVDISGGSLDASDFRFEFALAGGPTMEGIVVLGNLPSAGGLIGDYNGDGRVDAADYTVWRDRLGAETLPNRNPNNMGAVGDDDYDAWVANFGKTVASSSSAAVPEPASALLLLAGFGTLLAGRRSMAGANA